MKKISTRASIGSFQIVNEYDLSSEDVDALADMFARMVYRNLVSMRKNIPVTALEDTKEGTERNAEQTSDK